MACWSPSDEEDQEAVTDDDTIAAAVDALAEFFLVPRHLRHAIECRARRAVEAVSYVERVKVQKPRLRSIVNAVTVGVWRDWRNGVLEREIRPIQAASGE
jgi:hypothetical protein